MADVQPGTDAPSQPADSSPAPVDLASFTPEQTHKWRMTGDLPTDAPPDSSPAPSGDQTASTDATVAASETAKPADKPKKDIHTRHAELDTEIAALNRKLETVRTLREELARTPAREDAKPAESSPAKPKASDIARFTNHPDYPKEDDFEDYGDGVTARAAFVTRMVLQEERERERFETASKERLSTIERTIADFSKRLDDADIADPGWQDQVPAELRAITPAFAMKSDDVRPWNALMEEIVKSEFPDRLFKHFSTPEGGKEWMGMCQMSMPSALRAFGRLEVRLDQRADPAAPKVPAKPVTSAPDPPITLGRKPAEPADGEDSALKSGDFAAYKARANAREMAVRR